MYSIPFASAQEKEFKALTGTTPAGFDSPARPPFSAPPRDAFWRAAPAHRGIRAVPAGRGGHRPRGHAPSLAAATATGGGAPGARPAHRGVGRVRGAPRAAVRARGAPRPGIQ